jgi:hypothetical protein
MSSILHRTGTVVGLVLLLWGGLSWGEQEVVTLQPSVHLKSPPPIDPVRSVVIHPGDFPTWAALLAAHGDKLDILLTPGDYTPMGKLTMRSISGTLERPRTIRYYDPGTDHLHPAHRAPQALVAGITFRENTGPARHWYLYGLTSRNQPAGNGWDTGSQYGAPYITFDNFLIEGSGQDAALRVFTSHVTVQGGLIRDPVGAPLDGVGIHIKPLLGAAITGVMILDTEVKDYNDSFAITDDKNNPATPVEAIFDGVEGYITDLSRNAGCVTAITENSLDIKAGSDPPPIAIQPSPT